MQENTITIHLEGGNVQDVDGLGDDQKWEVLDWDTEGTYRWDEARKYINWIIFRSGKTLKEIMEMLQDILLRIDP